MPTQGTAQECFSTSLLSEFDFSNIDSRIHALNEFIRVVVEPFVSAFQKMIDQNRNDGPRFTLSWREEYGLGDPIVVICATRESGPRMSVLPIQVMLPGTLNVNEMGGSDNEKNGTFGLHGHACDNINELYDCTDEYGDSGRYAILTDLIFSTFLDFEPTLRGHPVGLTNVRENANGKSLTKVCFVTFLSKALKRVGCPLP